MMSLPEERSNVCSTCGKCFKRLAALENHERLAHPKDESLIRASCQERRVPLKKGDGKKTGKKIPKKKELPLEERGHSISSFSRQQGLQSNGTILLQQGVPGGVCFSNDNAVIRTLLHEGNEGQSTGFETTLNGIQDHNPAPEICTSGNSNDIETSYNDGSQTIGHQLLPKYLNITQNLSSGTYHCTDCKTQVDNVDFLFSHDCSESVNMDSVETPCKDCGMIVVECSCRKRQFQLVVKEKDPCCNTCGTASTDSVAENQPTCRCSGLECSHFRMRSPTEMVKEQHECLQSGFGRSVPPRAGAFGNDASVEERMETYMGLVDTQNKNTNNPQQDSVKCPYCKKLFINDLYLNNHMLSHSELQKFDCFYCRQLFPTGAALKEHLRTVHVQHPEEALPEQEAGVVVTDSGLKWKCSLCPKVFSCKSNRRRHQMWHFGIRPHPCELCGAAFRQRWQLQAHKKTKRCQENRTKTKTVLSKVSAAPIVKSLKPQGMKQKRVHSKVEEGEIIENSNGDFVRNIPLGNSNNHPQVSPTPASQAPLPEFAAIPTSSLSSSALHTAVTTKCLDQPILDNVPEDVPLDLTRLNSVEMEKTDTRSFICQECGKSCKTNRNLMIHKRIHTGERPYSCSLCSLTFRQSHHRKAHMLSKHGVYRPLPKESAKKEIVVMTEEGIRYKCHYCSKVLMSRSGRRKHERWHLGLRPHKCNNCGSMFKQLQHLKKHQMSSKCRVSQMKMMDTKDKKNDNDISHPRIIPLTSWHMMQVLAENHRRKKALAGNDNITGSSESDAPQVMDVPSAVGLISTEELKAKERAKKLAEDTSEKNPVNDENENVVESSISAHCYEEMGNITDDDAAEAETVSRYALENDEETIGGVSIKEEVHSEIEEGEIVDLDDNMSYQNCEASGMFRDFDDSETRAADDSSSALLNLTSGKKLDDEDSDKLYQAQCPICGQYYKTRQNLIIHMRIHTGERPHSCSICSKKFIQPHHLKAHLKSKHDIVMVTPSKPVRQEEIIMTQEGIRFKCQYCPKLLSSKNGRQKHERWHLGLRPHKCDVCGKAFKQSHHLKRHKAGSACIPLDKQQEIKKEVTEPLSPQPIKPAPLPKVAVNPSAPMTVLVPVTVRVAPSSVPEDLSVTEALAGQLPSERTPNNLETAQDLSVTEARPVQLPSNRTAINLETAQDLSVTKVQPGFLSKRTLINLDSVEDPPVMEGLPGRTHSELIPINLETAQEVSVQNFYNTAPLVETTEDLSPQDLSVTSSRLIDLHCYE